MSASETKRNRNTCVPRADGGTRAHALWPLWILFLSSLSPFSSLFSFSSLSPLSLFFFFSLFLSLFYPFFFTHAILHTHLSRFHRSTESATGVLLLANIAMSDRSDLFSFSIQYYATIENVRSVSRVRGKRCHVQRLPTSMMQLAFNPHSRTLKLNSTVQRETGLH